MALKCDFREISVEFSSRQGQQTERLPFTKDPDSAAQQRPSKMKIVGAAGAALVTGLAAGAATAATGLATLSIFAPVVGWVTGKSATWRIFNRRT